MPKRYNEYPSSIRSRKARRLRWKKLNTEVRISAKANPLNFLVILTQQEVADLLGVTRQRIHQIERNALWKIRQQKQQFL